jgi:hypothetical protein
MLSIASDLDDPEVEQNSQMSGDSRLMDVGMTRKISHRPLPIPKKFDEAVAGRVR